MGIGAYRKVAIMNLSWHWPWLAAAALALAVIVGIVTVIVTGRMRPQGPAVFSLDDDLNTEHAAGAFRRWRMLNRCAAALAALAIICCAAILARPRTVNVQREHSRTRDIVLCLDVSGSALPYDHEVIDTYRSLVRDFQGERIGMSIFNSTSRTVFPLTDDYALVERQLAQASDILDGVQSQQDIDQMSDKDYQRIADWLDGTQNRADETSLIGDGLISCAAMIPGFAYDRQDGSASEGGREPSIVLATDNVVSGHPTYTLQEALAITASAGIAVDGLYSGPVASEHDETTQSMKQLIEAQGGTVLMQSDADSIADLVRDIDRRQATPSEDDEAAIVDTPQWWVLACSICTVLWIALAWRLRR